MNIRESTAPQDLITSSMYLTTSRLSSSAKLSSRPSTSAAWLLALLQRASSCFPSSFLGMTALMLIGIRCIKSLQLQYQQSAIRSFRVRGEHQHTLLLRVSPPPPHTHTHTGELRPVEPSWSRADSRQDGQVLAQQQRSAGVASLLASHDGDRAEGCRCLDRTQLSVALCGCSVGKSNPSFPSS